MHEQLQLPAEWIGGMMNELQPPRVDARAEIARLTAAGYGPTDVARQLNARSIATPSGRGVWWPATVRRHANPAPWNAYIRRYRTAHPQR